MNAAPPVDTQYEQEEAAVTGAQAPAQRVDPSNASSSTDGSQPGQHEPGASEPAPAVPYVSVTTAAMTCRLLPF